VLFRFDRKSRAVDYKQSGYALPLYVGRITKVLTTEKIEVWWMFGQGWEERWMPWRDPKTKQAYKETMDTSLVLQDTFGMVAKLKFVTRRKQSYLDRDSKALIREILDAEEYSTGLE
jgi:hypothetical protein